MRMRLAVALPLWTALPFPTATGTRPPRARYGSWLCLASGFRSALRLRWRVFMVAPGDRLTPLALPAGTYRLGGFLEVDLEDVRVRVARWRKPSLSRRRHPRRTAPPVVRWTF